MEKFIKEIKDTSTDDLLLILKDQPDLYSDEEIGYIQKELALRGVDKQRIEEKLEHNEIVDHETESDESEDLEAEEEDDESLLDDVFTYSTASGKNLPYVVIQVTLKEKFWGTGSKNLTDLEMVINNQVEKGYRLHTMTTSNGGSKGLGGGDRIQATLVFEKVAYFKELGWK